MKAIIVTLFALCAPTTPKEVAPADPPIDADQHFCCNSVKIDTKTKVGTGEGCVAVGPANINTCNSVLFCPGLYTMQDTDVTCV